MQNTLAKKVETCFHKLDDKVYTSLESLNKKLDVRFDCLNDGVERTKHSLEVMQLQNNILCTIY